MGALPWGFFDHRFGPRLATGLSAAMSFVGALLFAFSTDSVDARFPGFFFMGIGSAGTLFGMFHLVIT